MPLLVHINIHQFDRADGCLVVWMGIPIVSVPILYILTFDVDDDTLTDGRRYAVRCYTKISTHFRAADASQIKLFTLIYSHCKIKRSGFTITTDQQNVPYLRVLNG